MSKISIRRLKEKPFLLITTILALCGWVISFGGACMLKVLYGAWWVIIYELCITVGHCLVFMSGSVQQYKIPMVAFSASSIPLLTIQVDYVIQYTKSNIPKMPANAYVSGYIILLATQYLWVLVLGSDKQSFLGRLGQVAEDQHNISENGRNEFEPEFYSEKLNNESRVSQPSSATYHRAMHPLNSSASVNTVSATAQRNSVPVEFRERVQALHTYRASKQDPNELDFEKGEILEIVDRKGNWWQARKENGAVGIIPSNYFPQI